MKPLRVVLFDVDGVLVPASDLTDFLRRDYGVTWRQLAEFFPEHFGACLTGKADLAVELAPFLKRWGWDRTTEEFIQRVFSRQNPVEPRLLQHVRTLRDSGVRCAVASNQEHRRAHYLTHEVALRTHFDDLFFSCHLGAKKPELAFCEEVTRRLSEEPDVILFWDDSPANVMAARVWGWHAELYTTFENFEAQLETYRPRLNLAPPPRE